MMPSPPIDTGLLRDADRAIAQGSKSFAAVSRLFDRDTRESVVLLYAWCRHCDDVVDGQKLGFGQSTQDAADTARRLDALTDATLRALRGEPPIAPPFAALAEVVRRHRIPHRFPIEHLSGFRMDADGRRYATLTDTLDYCYRVAGVVGVMMALVMGSRDDATLDRAADLGIAFQLTNIARDVIDDHGADRLYLPADWLAAERIDALRLDRPDQRAALARVAVRLVDAAEPYYDSARLGLARLPLRSAWAVAAARSVYREIGLQVKSRGASAWDRRIATHRTRKLLAVLGGAVVAAAGKAGLHGAVEPPARRREGLWNRPGRGVV